MGRRICSNEKLAFEPLSRRSPDPPEALQPLAACRLGHADRSFHAARRAGLPRQDRERHEGHGWQGQRRPRTRRPPGETRDANDDGFHESPQSERAGSASSPVDFDDADDGSRSDPGPDDNRTGHIGGSNDELGNGRDARIELVVHGIEHGGLRGVVSA
jgi:hypothetical protein